MEEKKNKKSKIIKGVALLGLFLLVFGVSYALFTVVLNGTKRNRITTGNLNLKLTDKNGVEEKDLPEGSMGIDLQGAVPMSVHEALESVSAYEFNIQNESTIPVDYELYIETTEDTTLQASNIKYSLVRTDTNEIISKNLFQSDATQEEYAEPVTEVSEKEIFSVTLLRDMETTKEGKVLYKLDFGTIGPNQTQKYAFKMWLSYASGEEAMNKVFDGRLKLYGYQASKDSAYALETAEIEKGDEFSVYAKLYSDNSIRLSGLGAIDTDDTRNTNYQLLLYKAFFDTETAIAEINNVMTKYDYDLFDSFNDLMLGMENIETRIPDEQCQNEVMQILDNMLAHAREHVDLYIEDGITRLGPGSGQASDELFGSGELYENVYISTTVNSMASKTFWNMPNLKKIEFLPARNTPYYKRAEAEGLNIYKNAISVTALQNINFLENLKKVQTNAIHGVNANVTVKAKQADVTVETDAFKNVKSVQWLQG